MQFPTINPEMIPTGGYSADNPPPLLVMPARRTPTPLTAEERELVIPALRESLSTIPFFAKRIAEGGDRYLHSYMDGMPMHRQGLPMPSCSLENTQFD
jgi:hypothetical protein